MSGIVSKALSMDFIEYRTACDVAQEWKENNNIYSIITGKDRSLLELEDEFNNFNSMTLASRLISNNTSIEIFGVINDVHYNYRKLIYVPEEVSTEITPEYIPDKALAENRTLSLDGTSDNLVNIEIPDIEHPFLLPTEIIDNLSTSAIQSEFSKRWINEYNKAISGKPYDKKVFSEWVSELRKLTYKYNILKENGESLEDIEDQIISLGWIPGFSFDVEDRYNANMFMKNTIKYHPGFEVSDALHEMKEFPLGFDKEGNFIIRNFNKLDFEEEYKKTHKLLQSFEKSNSIDSIKYELSKLWFINLSLEEKIADKNIDNIKRNKLTDTRARVLNDFNRYLKFIIVNDKKFNFSRYYESTKFHDVKFRIHRSTIKYTIEYLKSLIYL